ncbi:Arrestin-N domain-containing protein [Mycena indigotica]|uniref:Arrestin-N domain-containing protein n=1 Tax=Mycena indigotica TaxID=2126181 RepID=A0A8H6RZP4_9AGAR|nr:Arrestin-N domain-containing protein [Mycena indigotica]KAF7289346.1 Arrestin-N domain-containing protein [Mycena indigotica]
MSPPSDDGPITLQFRNITRVAGETLQGTVLVNVQLAQEDKIEQVRIKFRGSIHTSITESNGQSSTTYKQTIPLFHQKTPLWTQGSAYPDPGSHILSLPFEFTLPADLPPSFHCYAVNRHATIGYSLEVVGDRPGMFKFNRRIRRAISIVPAATPRQLLTRESLLQTWTGAWKPWVREEKLRRGIWGDYSHARATFTMPHLGFYPISTPIPFSLLIETDTKPMDREDCPDKPVDKNGKPLFPAPPTLSSEVKLSLYRWTQLRVKSRVRQVEDTYKLSNSLGDPHCVAAVVHTESPPEWIVAPGSKDEKGKGFWRRAIKFESAVTINYAPTWQGETLRWHYQLTFTIPFPGIRNDFKIFIPIQLDTSRPCPPPPKGVAGSSGPSYADVLPPGPPPMLDDLPPAYWAGDHHGWEDDKK